MDRDGKVSIRRAGKMHHLGIGRKHTAAPVLILIDENTATVTHLTTGEVLSNHNIDADKSYWRDQNKEPGRWPGSS